MPRNGAGSYSLPTGNPVVTGTAISSTVHNNTMTDLGTALTQSLAKDGQTTPSANLPMGSFRHTGVGNGVARTDYPSIGQVQDSSFMWCGTATGTANALLLVPTPIVPAIGAGQRFVFKSGAAPNSGATTVSISTLPTIAVQVNSTACVGGEILANSYYEVIMDASTTSCQLNKIGRATLAELGAAASGALATSGITGAATSGANSNITSLTGLTNMSAFYAFAGSTASALAVATNYGKTFDVNNDFNATTGVFTAPVAGIYEFGAAGQLPITANREMLANIRVNGSIVASGGARTDGTIATTVNIRTPVTYLANLAAGNTVDVSLSLANYTAGTCDYFWGKRIL